MKGAILQTGEQYYTYMGRIFYAIENSQLEYNWLITNCECYPHDKVFSELFARDYLWISGKHLTEIIHKEDFQFIWGVFSGFSPHVALEQVLKYDLPFANGYEGFRANTIGVQHQLGDIEIVVWDSSLVLLISKDDNLVEKFRSNIPLSEDLLEFNLRNNGQA